MVESRRRRREGARRGWMDSRVESRRGIWRGVGGADRGRDWTRGEGSGARRGVPRLGCASLPVPPRHRRRRAIGRRRRRPRPGGHHRPPRTSRARPPRPPARRRWTRARIPRAPRTTRVVRWTRNATRTSRRDARARGSPRAIARSPPSRCCLLSNEIVPRRTRHRATRSRRAERVAPHTRERGSPARLPPRMSRSSSSSSSRLAPPRAVGCGRARAIKREAPRCVLLWAAPRFKSGRIARPPKRFSPRLDFLGIARAHPRRHNRSAHHAQRTSGDMDPNVNPVRTPPRATSVTRVPYPRASRSARLASTPSRTASSPFHARLRRWPPRPSVR